MTDFKTAKELLELCRERDIPISQAMRLRETEALERPAGEAEAEMRRVWDTMVDSARAALDCPKPSMGGYIGGQAKALADHRDRAICGDTLSRAMAYAMGVLEVNASMGLIVAAPTAGASGVVPGLLLALQESFQLPVERVLDGLWNAGAVGYLATRNAAVSGAVAGCQAEVGVAAAMAASAAVEMLGGAPEGCLDAASTVLMNLLGLVRDPVGGLVEYPCQNRNAAGVAVALSAAELALSGVRQRIDLDRMLKIMLQVGRQIPPSLRETAQGGCATAF